MNASTGGSPNNVGLVPILVDGKSLMCCWIKSCDVRCVAAKMRLSDLKGPLAAVVFHGTSKEGEGDGHVYMKVISDAWVINMELYHWPQGSGVPSALNLPFDTRDGVARSGGDGAYVSWSDGTHQSIRLFSVRSPKPKDEKLWQLVRCVNTACKALGSVIAEELSSGEAESLPHAPTVGEGELRAAAQAARQADAAQPAATTSARFRVIRQGRTIEYDGTAYEFGGDRRWDNVAKLIAGNGRYVACDKGLKSLFASTDGSKAFYEAAIEPEGAGRKGTGQYRLKL